jgi:hypothetical protein
VRLDHITPKRLGVFLDDANATRRESKCAGLEGTAGARAPAGLSKSLPGGYSEWEPPDPIPNSEVKTLCADDSVAASHAKVGHCQALKQNP